MTYRFLCFFFSFCQAQDLHYFAHCIYFFCYKFPLIPSPSHFSFLPFHHTCINTHIKCIHKHTQRDTEMQSYRNAQRHTHTHTPQTTERCILLEQTLHISYTYIHTHHPQNVSFQTICNFPFLSASISPSIKLGRNAILPGLL